jgi:hypothetical protein
MYLSKGVIPFVSRWILDQLRDHLEDVPREAHTWEVACDPDYIADFRIRKKEWERYWETGQLPELRQWHS